jgi:hypothetical protein
MKQRLKEKGLTIGVPATYRIGVQGCLHKSWADRLSGMRIYTHGKEERPPVTTLVGRMRDQAELMGVLSSLYELHLPLLFVEVLQGKHRIPLRSQPTRKMKR